MSKLHLRLLGGFSVNLDNQPVHNFRSSKSRALLAWLACHPDVAHQRTQLATLLWHDYSEKSARTNLRIELSALKKQLNAHPALDITRTTVRFHRAAASVDVLTFWDNLDKPAQLLALYGGEFLIGLNVDDAPDFEDWKLLTQERVHRQVMGALDQLRQTHAANGAWDSLIEVATQQLELVAWHEQAHYSLMEAMVAQGDVAGARAQYERCRAVLAAELGVTPSAEIEAMRRTLGQANPTRQTVVLPPTSFFGRSAEKVHLLTLLQSPDYRLITLLGPGGIGKTHLALVVGQAATTHFADGVFFVALEQTEPTDDALALAMLDALDAKVQSQTPPLDQLISQLQQRHSLLILDNFEHLVDSALVISQLIQRVPTLSVIVTSRVRLDLRAEYVFRLEGLPSEDGLRAESVQLFLDRAERHGSEERLSAENIAAITQICRAVEGMPLAIELAAAATRQYDLPTIAAQISSNLAILTTKLRDVPPRQRSLIATCTYAWQLLTSAQQQLLSGAAYFAGGFSQRAGTTVLRTTPSALGELVDHSLLRWSGKRYEMHPLILQFSAEKSPTPTLVQSHADYYAAQLRDIFADFLEKRTTETFTPAFGDLPNVLKAWRTLIAIGDTETGLPFCKALFALYAVHGRLHAGLAAFEPAHKTLAAMPNQDADLRRLTANVAARTSYFLLFLGRHDEAKPLLETALETLLQLEDTSGIEFALTALGDIAKLEGDYELGLRLATLSLDLLDSAEPTERRGRILGNLGTALQTIGRLEEALIHYREALAISRQLANESTVGIALNNLGSALTEMGQFAEAEAVLNEGLALRRKAGNQHRVASSLRELGRFALANGQSAQAIAYFKESYQLFRENDVSGGQLVTLVELAQAHLETQDVVAAQTAIDEAVPLALSLGETPRALRLLSVIGGLLLATERTARGKELLRWVAGHRGTQHATRLYCQQILGDAAMASHSADWRPILKRWM